jgi:hypothetical protein
LDNLAHTAYLERTDKPHRVYQHTLWKPVLSSEQLMSAGTSNMAQADRPTEDLRPHIHGAHQDRAKYQEIEVSVAITDVEMMDTVDDLEMVTPDPDTPSAIKVPNGQSSVLHLLPVWASQGSNEGLDTQIAYEARRP